MATNKTKKKEPTRYILNGNEYSAKDVTFELICQDVAFRKNDEARTFVLNNKDENFLTFRKEYLRDHAEKVKTKKELALKLLEWGK